MSETKIGEPRLSIFKPTAVGVALSLAVLASLPAPARAQNIVNNPTFSPANGSVGYGAVPGWTQSPYPSTLPGFPYLTGSNAEFVQPFWNDGTVPAGISTVGFIEVFPGAPTNSLQQTLTLAVGTTYSLSYRENARSGYPAPLVEVRVGGQPVITSHVDNPVGATNSFRVYTGLFAATASSELLQFVVTQLNADDDATALITDVQVVATTPTPAQRIASLITSTLMVNLSSNVQSQLDAKLEAAIATLDAARNSSPGTAANQLQAFVNAVKGDVQSAKITCVQATALVQAAQQIVAVLGQPPLSVSLTCQ